ncbi:MAG: GNAT family N-acetyltransferase [Actinomycetota bacterium]|nr:GNAT family N-acetyltransferase [Actinomycetota bacterium]
MSSTSTRHRLRSGHRVRVRPLNRGDGPVLARMWDELSEQSRYRRFFTLKSRLSERTLEFLTDIDHHDHEALAAVAPGGDLVGVARFVRFAKQPETADLAVTVVDAWQRRGLGTLLLEQLSARAAAVGVTCFTAEILAENTPMIGLARQAGSESVGVAGGGTVVARLAVTDRTEQPTSNILRAVARGEFGPLAGPFRF